MTAHAKYRVQDSPAAASSTACTRMSLSKIHTSVKVPGLFSYPGKIPAGAVCGEMASHYDLYQTILDMAGVPYSRDESLPGKSFAGILTGSQERFRDEVVVYDEYGPVRMIRTKEWKYVHRYPDGPHELYDLVQDPEEYRNLADDPRFAGMIADMRTQLSQWFQRYVDPALDGSRERVSGRGQLDSHHFI